MTAYERRIGRYGAELAEAMLAMVELRPGARVLDVGCGTGALTEPLAAAVGPHGVAAIDPAPGDVEACARRVPGADVRVGVAEALPYPDDAFDATLAQLVLSMVGDGPRAAAEMRRVTRPGGPVATCVWDFAGGMTVLRLFWDAAAAVDPAGAARHDQANTRPYGSREELERLWRGAGLRDVSSGALTAGTTYADLDDLWLPLAAPDGGPGEYLQTLDDAARDAIRERLFDALQRPAAPFRLEARAWAVVGYA